ncbi:MAG: RnfABCDGE type electron transport complex subunit G [Tannerellaceae bacterium]|jgi:electron transport complex protein RnfG|nr:RnfABCDGE type electron transport complex subunit G [Tannerellaceae bacterium]
MEKLSSTLPNMFLSLMITCAVSGIILAGANMYTAGPIALSKAAALEKAISDVTPDFDNNPLDEAYHGVTSDGDSLRIYPALKDGQLVGVAVDSYTKNGFSGEIKIIVGFDAEGTLINYAVLQHAETPGLGSKMDEWFRTDKNQQSVIGRSLAGGNLAVSKDGGNVDAITASTITSRAFLDAINRAYSAYKGTSTDSTTGASTKKGDSYE